MITNVYYLDLILNSLGVLIVEINLLPHFFV